VEKLEKLSDENDTTLVWHYNVPAFSAV